MPCAFAPHQAVPPWETPLPLTLEKDFFGNPKEILLQSRTTAKAAMPWAQAHRTYQ